MKTLKCTPISLDLNIYAGDDLTFTLTLRYPDGLLYDLTGDVAAEVRQSHSGAVVATFALVVPDPESGKVICHLAVADTDALYADGGVHKWDLQHTTVDRSTITLVAGGCFTSPDITQVS